MSEAQGLGEAISETSSEASEPALGQVAPPAPAASDAPTGSNDNFIASLPEDLRGHELFAKTQSAEDFARAAIDAHDRGKGAQSLIGKRVDELAADPEKWNETLIASGHMPKEAGDYQIEQGQMPQGMQWDSDREGWFRGVAHKHGLTKAQVKGLAKAWQDREIASYTDYQANNSRSQEEQKAALDREFGLAKDAKFNLANDAIRTFAGDGYADVVNKLNAAGLGTDPQIVKLFAKIGEASGEDKLTTGERSAGVLSPEDANREINAKYRDKEFMAAYNNKGHAGHAGAVAEMNQLFKYKAGER